MAEDVEAFAATWFGGDRNDKTIHAKLYAALDPALLPELVDAEPVRRAQMIVENECRHTIGLLERQRLLEGVPEGPLVDDAVEGGREHDDVDTAGWHRLKLVAIGTTFQD